MKTIIVDQDLKRLVNATVTPGDGRHALENIMVKDDVAYATNGHIMVYEPVETDIKEATNGACYIKNNIIQGMKLGSGLNAVQVNENTITRVDKTGKVMFDYEEVSYPDVDMVIRDADSNQVKAKVTFNKTVLENLLKCFDKCDDILFEISANDQPVKVSARNIKAVIMPCKE